MKENSGACDPREAERRLLQGESPPQVRGGPRIDTLA